MDLEGKRVDESGTEDMLKESGESIPLVGGLLYPL